MSYRIKLQQTTHLIVRMLKMSTVFYERAWTCGRMATGSIHDMAISAHAHLTYSVVPKNDEKWNAMLVLCFFRKLTETELSAFVNTLIASFKSVSIKFMALWISARFSGEFRSWINDSRLCLDQTSLFRVKFFWWLFGWCWHRITQAMGMFLESMFCNTLILCGRAESDGVRKNEVVNNTTSDRGYVGVAAI